MSGGDAGAAGATLRIALAEYDIGWHQPSASLARATVCVERACTLGARLVVLPEMCTTGFTMSPQQWAEPLDGKSAMRLAELAREHDIFILAGLSVREGTSYRNVAALFDADGSVAATYSKQKLFGYANEDATYDAGSGSVVVDVDGVRVAPFICYDLRFPELFRAVALQSDVMIVVANWPASRRSHWDALLPARAIENQAYVVGVNRTGFGGGLAYDGGSAAYDPWGVPVVSKQLAAAPSVVDVSTAMVREVRTKFPFLQDMRDATARW